MKKIILILAIISIVTLSFSISDEAKSYYLAGVRAYQMQDCLNAIKWFKKALVKDSSIEEYDPQVKFKIGYCAYIVGDYEMAKDYLSLYPDNPVAVNLLKSIKRVKEEEEWKKWLDIPKETKIIPSTSTEEATETKAKKKAHIPFKVYLLMLGIFLIIYVTVFFLELKTRIITKLMGKLMGRAIPQESLEVKQVAEEISEKETPETSEKEIEIDLEEILNAPLDTVDKLIYGDSFEAEEQEEEAEAPEIEKVEESQEPEEVENKEEVEVAEKNEKEMTLESDENEIEEVEKTEKDLVMGELSRQEEKETLTTEDEVMSKANEILKELEDNEESLPVELAGRSIEEIMEELEEKDSYDPEDAEAFMYILNNLINGENMEGETKEVKEEANS